MKTYLLERVDGGVCVMRCPDDKTDPAAEIARWHPSQQAEVTGAFTEISEAAIPADRSFRNAWTRDGQGVGVDFTKAQALTKDRLRRERAPLLDALDVQLQRALESGADTAPIIAEKQRLRDVTLLVDTAATLDELKALRP
jgi:hypothetical protein